MLQFFKENLKRLSKNVKKLQLVVFMRRNTSDFIVMCNKLLYWYWKGNTGLEGVAE
jgi:hypothetical protein